jgi:hypothetical protein
MQFRAKFGHGHEVQMSPSEIDMTMPPSTEKVVEISVRSSEAISTDVPALLQLHWAMGYDLANKEELMLSGTRDIPLRPSRVDLIRTVAPEFARPLSVELIEPDEDLVVNYTMDGKAPTAESSAYGGRFVVDDTTTLRARMFNAQGHGTATVSQTYKRVPPGRGLRYRVYEGSWTRMPAYSDLKPMFEGVASDLNVESREPWPDNWGMVLEGDFEIERAGKYSFFMNSDDGSKLYIDDELVIDNDGDHSLLELSGEKELSSGKHKLRIEFFEAGGEAILELDYAGPGLERRPFPVERMTH